MDHMDNEQMASMQHTISVSSLLPSFPEQSLPKLPIVIIVRHILPFLDRPTWNHVVTCSINMWKTSKKHMLGKSQPGSSRMTCFPPWPQRNFAMPHRINAIVFAPKSQCQSIAMVRHQSSSILLWDQWRGSKYHSKLTGHKREVLHVTFSRDGRFLASSSVDKTIRLWSQSNTTSGDVSLQSQCTGFHNLVTVQCWNTSSFIETLSFPAGACSNQLVALDYQDVAMVWNVSSISIPVVCEHDKFPLLKMDDVIYNFATLFPDGRSMVAVQWKNHLTVQTNPDDMESRHQPATVTVVGDDTDMPVRITSMVVTRDGASVLVGCSDWTIQEFQLPTLEAMHTIDLLHGAMGRNKQSKPYISDMQFCADGTKLMYSFFRTTNECVVQVVSLGVGKKSNKQGEPSIGDSARIADCLVQAFKKHASNASGSSAGNNDSNNNETEEAATKMEVFEMHVSDSIEALSLLPNNGNVVAYCAGQQLHLRHIKA